MGEPTPARASMFIDLQRPECKTTLSSRDVETIFEPPPVPYSRNSNMAGALHIDVGFGFLESEELRKEYRSSLVYVQLDSEAKTGPAQYFLDLFITSCTNDHARVRRRRRSEEALTNLRQNFKNNCNAFYLGPTAFPMPRMQSFSKKASSRTRPTTSCT